MKASCAPKDWATFDWSKCAAASKALADKCAKVPKKIAKACSKWGPKEPADVNALEASAKPEDAKCDAALEKMRDACAAPAKDAKDASPYDWKKCADASKALAAACAKPGPKPDSPFNFLACVAQAKLTESECA